MANTWRAYAASVAHAATKHMIDIFSTASNTTQYMRVYRIFTFPTGTTTVTAVNQRMSIVKTSGTPGASTVTAVAHNAGYSALNANVTCGTARTLTAGNVHRSMFVTTDEIAISTFDADTFWCLVPFAELWNSGYGDSNVEPLTIVPSVAEGWSLYSTTALTSSALDIEMEFTDATS